MAVRNSHWLWIVLLLVVIVWCMFSKNTDVGDPLAVFYEQNQAFCANTWCKPGPGNTSLCKCPVFNNYGLAPLSSMLKYQNDPNVTVSTYDILQGTSQPPPTMCVGKYIDCYGKPCYTNYADQGKVLCHCKVGEGPFLTASSTCGPDAYGNLPNGAAIAKSPRGIANANSIIQIMEAVRRK
jgi:hypothetical protein